LDEALPGDTKKVDMTGFARLATPVHPIMDNMYMSSFFFAVPLRLLWDNFQKFMGEQEDPGDSTDFLMPEISAPAGGYTELSLEDYFGLPLGVAGLTHHAMFHRAMNLIWNEWFRDQNLQNSLTVPKGDGPDDPALYTLLRRGKRHDYFTSCLPWPQKGPAVELPLGSTAPVATDANVGGDIGVFSTVAGNSRKMDASGAHVSLTSTAGSNDLYADLSSATAATINAIREAFQVQKMYEKDARGGTRYTEIVRSHFGVVSPDARLQRPEYLGGSTSPVSVAPVAQTGESATTPQGNLAGIGTMQAMGHGFTKSFTEHCVIIGLVSVRADLTYQRGLNRMWSRSTRFDHYFPTLAHLGEQAVLKKEIWADGGSGDDDVFGYQERWAEMRYKPSLITGRFRSTAAQSLDNWHLSEDFLTRPALGSTFIEENPPVDRVIAVPAEPHFLWDSWFDYRDVRPLPVYGVPGQMDRF
jgi:hypothetical protein